MSSSDEAGEPAGTASHEGSIGRPDPKAVARRAEDRPPEEASSDDPMAQAEAVLEDSEARMAAGAARADDGS